MNKQKKLERKKKHREKIRTKHLESNRARDKRQYALELINAKFTVKTIPDRNDRVGWQRLNAIRDFKQIFDKAKQLFPNEKVLDDFAYGEIGYGQNDKYRTLSFILTAAVQELCPDAPYYIPYMNISSTEEGYSANMTTLEFKKIFMSSGPAWVVNIPKTVTINGKQYEMCFTTHALERLYERAMIHKEPTPTDRTIRNSFFLQMLGGYRAEVSQKHTLIEMINENKKITCLVGINKPFGYCAYQIEENYAKAITFLLPGMDGTPERNILTERVEIVDIASLHAINKEGLDLFTVEASKEIQRLSDRGRNIMPSGIGKK